MRSPVLILAAALFVRIACATDAADIIEKPVTADTPATFAQQAAWIEQEMQPDGRYEFTKPADRQRVKVLLAQMSNLLERSGSVAAMDQSARLALFNDQEEVNGLLKHNDADRLVCESRQPIGSHIPVTHCHTYRQSKKRRAIRRSACSSSICRACATDLAAIRMPAHLAHTSGRPAVTESWQRHDRSRCRETARREAGAT